MKLKIFIILTLLLIFSGLLYAETEKFDSVAELPKIENIEEPPTESFPWIWILGGLITILGIIFWFAGGLNHLFNLYDRLANKNGETFIKSEMNKKKILAKRKIYEKLKESNHYIEKILEKISEDEGDERDEEEDIFSDAKRVIDGAEVLLAKYESDFSTEFKDNANNTIEELSSTYEDCVELWDINYGEDYSDYEEDELDKLCRKINKEIGKSQKEIKKRLDKMHKQITEGV